MCEHVKKNIRIMSLSDKIIDWIKEYKNFNTDTELAIYLKVKPNTITTWKKRKAIPHKRIVAFCENESVSLDYILMGKGKMIQKPGKNEFKVAESDGIYNKVGDLLDENPVVAELLEAARKVLKSGNQVAHSALKRNIEYFLKAIDAETELAETKKRLSNIEDEVAALRSLVAGPTERTERRYVGNDDRIRHYDPPEKKEELIKMRTMSSL